VQGVGYAARNGDGGWLMRRVCYNLHLVGVEVVVGNCQGRRIQRGGYVVLCLDVGGHVG